MTVYAAELKLVGTVDQVLGTHASPEQVSQIKDGLRTIFGDHVHDRFVVTFALEKPK